MTIEEAIQHCYEVANGKGNQCDECRKEHLQLAKWLEENAELKRLLRLAVEDLHKFGESIPTCYFKDCPCDCDNKCKWKHHVEALNLIGGE